MGPSISICKRNKKKRQLKKKVSKISAILRYGELL